VPKEAAVTIADKTIRWQTDLDDALKDARARRRLVLLDFSAAPM
jgi:hypothetical protein